MRKTARSSSGYRFYNMGGRPLVYDVKCGSKIAIPAGTKHVKIAFGQSHLRRWDEDKQKFVPMNVYLWKKPGIGMKLVHA